MVVQAITRLWRLGEHRRSMFRHVRPGCKASLSLLIFQASDMQLNGWLASHDLPKHGSRLNRRGRVRRVILGNIPMPLLAWKTNPFVGEQGGG